MTSWPASDDAVYISVVVPSDRVDDDLRAQLESVVAQELIHPFEVIVSLNSDGPDQRAALEQLVLEIDDSRLRVVEAADRRGAAYARNVGAAAARAPLLAFCDADDVTRPGWLKALADALVDHAAVGGRLVDFTDRGHLPKWRPPATPGALPTFLGVPYLVSANMAITTDAFADVGGFDETLTRCEDIAISWRLIERGHSLAFQPDAVVDYRVRTSIYAMLRQHHMYGIGMSEVLIRTGMPGALSGGSSALIRPNSQPGGLGSPIAVLRKVAIATGRLRGIAREYCRRRKCDPQR